MANVKVTTDAFNLFDRESADYFSCASNICLCCCADKCACIDDGCGAGVCHSEQYNRQTAVRSSMFMDAFSHFSALFK